MAMQNRLKLKYMTPLENRRTTRPKGNGIAAEVIKASRIHDVYITVS